MKKKKKMDRAYEYADQAEALSDGLLVEIGLDSVERMQAKALMIMLVRWSSDTLRTLVALGMPKDRAPLVITSAMAAALKGLDHYVAFKQQEQESKKG